jgi:hypothetical protein
MTATAEQLVRRIRRLPDLDKLAIVDSILTDLDQPDPDVDKVWAEEARKRWKAYRAGRLRAIPYAKVMAKYRRS